MPYVMVMGSLSAQHLSKDEGVTVYGLKREERASLVTELNSSFLMSIAVASNQDRTVRVMQKGLTLVVVNRLHALFGYDVVSHAMAMTNANRELISFTMYKKSSPGSHGESHGHSHGQSKHGHNLGQSQHGHSLGQSQHGHSLGQSQHGHSLGQSQHGHSLGQSQHGQSQHGHSLGQSQHGQSQHGHSLGQSHTSSYKGKE